MEGESELSKKCFMNSKETDNVYCYEIEIDGKHGVIVYPDEIDE